MLGGNTRVTKLGNVHTSCTKRWHLGVWNGMRNPGSCVREEHCQRGLVSVFGFLASVLINDAEAAFRVVKSIKSIKAASASGLNDAEAAFKQVRFDHSESLEIVHVAAYIDSSTCTTTWTEPRTRTLKHDLYTRRQRRAACERGRTGLDGAQNGGRHALLLFSVIWYATPHPRSQARNLEPCTGTTTNCEIAVRFFGGMRWGEEGFPPMFLSANHQ